MQEVLVNRLGGLSLPSKSVVRLTDRPDMTLDVYRGRKTTMQQQATGFYCIQPFIITHPSSHITEKLLKRRQNLKSSIHPLQATLLL